MEWRAHRNRPRRRSPRRLTEALDDAISTSVFLGCWIPTALAVPVPRSASEVKAACVRRAIDRIASALLDGGRDGAWRPSRAAKRLQVRLARRPAPARR